MTAVRRVFAYLEVNRISCWLTHVNNLLGINQDIECV